MKLFQTLALAAVLSAPAAAAPFAFSNSDFSLPRVTPTKEPPRPPRTPLAVPLDSAPQVSLPANARAKNWLGERMKFEIGWSFLTVGHAEIWTENVVSVDSVPCYHIISTAKSATVIDAFFKVRDKNQTWIAADTLYSRAYSKLIREGNYFWDEWVTFDYDKKTFTGVQKTNRDALENLSGEIPGPVQDIFSAMYYVRAQPLKEGQQFSIDVNSGKNWPLYVNVYPQRETVKVQAGKFDCFVVEPTLRDKGLFVQKGKSLKVWITADERRIPVKMEAEVFIGHVSAELEEYSDTKK